MSLEDLDTVLADAAKMVARARLGYKSTERLNKAVYDLIGVLRAELKELRSLQREVRDQADCLGNHLLKHEKEEKPINGGGRGRRRELQG